jgi:hypothetical protein
MKNYFKILIQTVWEMFIVFCLIVQFKIRLIFWKPTTETILFDSFLKDETSSLFIEYYFPVLYRKFIYLLKETLSCQENES